MNKCYQSHPCSPNKKTERSAQKFQLLNHLTKILMLSCLVILVVSFTKNVDEIMLATTPSTKKVMLPVTRPWAKKPRESPIEGLRRVVPKKIRRRFFMDPGHLDLEPRLLWGQLRTLFQYEFWRHGWEVCENIFEYNMSTRYCNCTTWYIPSGIWKRWIIPYSSRLKQSILGRLPSRLRSQKFRSPFFYQCFYSATLGILMFFTAATHVAGKCIMPRSKSIPANNSHN